MQHWKWMLFSWKGCLHRLPYFCCGIVLNTIVTILEKRSDFVDSLWISLWISLGIAVCMYMHTCTTIKRMHDIGYSGWWIALPFAAGLFVLIALEGAQILSLYLIVATIAASFIILSFSLFLLLRPPKFKNNKYREPKTDNGTKEEE